MWAVMSIAKSVLVAHYIVSKSKKGQCSVVLIKEHLLMAQCSMTCRIDL